MSVRFSRQSSPMPERFGPLDFKCPYNVEQFCDRTDGDNPAYLRSDLYIPPVLERKEKFLKFKGITRKSGEELPEKIREQTYRHICVPSAVQFLGKLCFAPLGANGNPFVQMSKVECVTFGRDSLCKRISAFAFQGSNIRSIYIPQAVEVIEEGAFEGCQRLSCVCFEPGSKLKRIEDRVFAKTALSSFEIPESVEFISSSAFAGTKVENFYVHPNNTTYVVNGEWITSPQKDKVLRYIGRGKHVFVGDGVTVIGPRAFADSAIVAIDIPSTVREIGDGCFADCLQLKTVNIDLATTSLVTIGEKAFSNTSIESFVVPSKVTSLGALCFYKSSKLTKVEFQEPVQITEFGQYMFAWTNIERFDIPPAIQKIHKAAFGQCEKLHVCVFPDNSQLKFMDEYAFACQPEDARLIPESKKSFLQICLPASLQTVGKACFLHLKSLQKVTFGPNAQLQDFSDYMFQFSCVKEVFVPATVQKIGRFALSDCSVEHVTFEAPAQVTELALCAFQNSMLQEIEIPATVKFIGVTCFGGCDKLTSLTFMEGSQLELVLDAAFSLARMKTIIIPKTLEALGKKNFYCCWSLEEVKFEPGSRLKKVCEMAFEWSSVQCVVFPPTLEELERGCFWRCQGIKSISFESPAIVRTFGPKLFGYSSLFILKVPASVKQISKSCFSWSSSLTTIELEEGSQLERIEEYAFRNTRLSSFCIPKLVSYVGGGCFVGCPASFTLTIAPENTHLKLQDNMLLTASGDTLLTVIGQMTEVTVPAGVRVIGTSAFAASTAVKVTFEQPCVVEEFGKSAFRNSPVQALDVPDSVKVIRAKCFSGSERTKNVLSAINFGKESHLSELGDKAFQFSLLREISLPASLEKIGKNAFEGCRLTRLNYEGPSKLATADDAFVKLVVMEITGDEKAVALTHANLPKGVAGDDVGDGLDEGSSGMASSWNTEKSDDWGGSSWGSSSGGFSSSGFKPRSFDS